MIYRVATPQDVLDIQHCNQLCLPETYSIKYYIYHISTWPQLNFVAEDENSRIVGYVLAKILESKTPNDRQQGHISSLAVKRSHRRMGIAQHLVSQVVHVLMESFSADLISLHVRAKNTAAINLYQNVLGFKIMRFESQFYENNDDAFTMMCDLRDYDTFFLDDILGECGAFAEASGLDKGNIVYEVLRGETNSKQIVYELKAPYRPDSFPKEQDDQKNNNDAIEEERKKDGEPMTEESEKSQKQDQCEQENAEDQPDEQGSKEGGS